MKRTCYALTLQDSNWYNRGGDMLSIQNEPYVALLVSKLRKQIPDKDYLAIFADENIFNLISTHEIATSLDGLQLRSGSSIVSCLQNIFSIFSDCHQATWINSRQLYPCIEDIISASMFLEIHDDIDLVLSSAEDVTARFVGTKFISERHSVAASTAYTLPFFDRENLLPNTYYTRAFFSVKRNSLSSLYNFNSGSTFLYASRKPLFIDDLLPYVNDAILAQIIIAWLLGK